MDDRTEGQGQEQGRDKAENQPRHRPSYDARQSHAEMHKRQTIREETRKLSTRQDLFLNPESSPPQSLPVGVSWATGLLRTRGLILSLISAFPFFVWQRSLSRYFILES